MALLQRWLYLRPPSGTWYPHAHVNARRMWYKRERRGEPIPPLSISLAHVDYNYLQVITTHTTVFQWVLTAVRPLYSAKLVFPFPVEESRTEIVRGREKEKETEKRRNFRRPLVGPRFNAPRVLTLFHLILWLFHPRSLPTVIHGRVYFCNLLEDQQLDFLGSFGYRISARLPRSGLDRTAQTARKYILGEMTTGTTYTCLV